MRQLSIAILFIVVFLPSCFFSGKRVVGNNHVETEERNISRASKIKLSGSMNVVITEGPASVRVEAEENILPYVITELDDSWLEIKTRNNVNLKTHHPITVYVSTPALTHVRAAGSGTVKTDKKFNSDGPISVDIAGSGDVEMQVRAPKVDADIAGSGSLNISGETRDVDVSIVGSGNFRGDEMKAENASVKIVGSGDAYVFADIQLDANLIGSGNVNYRGKATVEKKVVGSGTVRKL